MSPNSHDSLTGLLREEPVNDDIPTETQQLVRCRRRSGECSEISRGSHDAKRHTSGRSLSTSEFLFGAIGRVGLHAHLAAMTCLRSGDCAVCKQSIRDPFGSAFGSSPSARVGPDHGVISDCEMVHGGDN